MITVLNGNDSGPGSLRQAVIDAVDGDTITFDSGLVLISLTSAEIDVNKNLTITGPGSGVLTVQRSGGTQFRIFHITNPVSGTPSTVTITGMRIYNGFAVLNHGGGIFAEHLGGGSVSTLNLTDVIFDSNQNTGVVGGHGGGLAAHFILNMTSCTFTGNHSQYSTGGAYATYDAVVTNCTFIGNSSDLHCGAFYGQTNVTMRNCVIGTALSPNTCGRNGGGAFMAGTTLVEDCTMEHNVAGTDPGTWGGSQCFIASTAVLRRSTFTNGATGVPAVWNELSTLVMEDCTMVGTNNHALFNNHATTFLTRCTATGVADQSKAAVWNDVGAVNLDSCTIAGNLGFGIYDNQGAVDICHCTICSNWKGLLAADGADSFQNSIFCGNTVSDIEKGVATSPSLISNGYNVFGVIPMGMTTTTGDQTSVAFVDLKIDALADNGGYTHTMALQVDSPAVDAGLAAGGLAGGGYTNAVDGGTYLLIPPATDQRLASRVVNLLMDIGAYERGAPTPPTPPPAPEPSPCPQLLTQTQCYNCFGATLAQSFRLEALSKIATLLDPMAANPQTLLSQTTCYAAYGLSIADLLELGLLNVIYASLGGLGGASVLCANLGGGAPMAPPAGSCAIEFDTSTGTQWNYYSGAWH